MLMLPREIKLFIHIRVRYNRSNNQPQPTGVVLQIIKVQLGHRHEGDVLAQDLTHQGILAAAEAAGGLDGDAELLACIFDVAGDFNSTLDEHPVPDFKLPALLQAHQGAGEATFFYFGQHFS
ncbi:hypothetical protein Dred_0562 [Desulforamulus reducens MI-1]|uniref:Uncharacterized protein n=1 Tax=Desulforamulus reducens (strain ATCC BAA-1160 / DSM 100696 / MI-1) TaxID=349161 RepID=A4J203_DESRM|nr:hypothetical protein Dred_0562 [Desulforamulus reducens MI-1]